MKKTALLNAPLSATIAELGHTDNIVLCDPGLPIPPQSKRIDLAVTRGLPTFLDVFRIMASELCIEGITIASEMQVESPKFFAAFMAEIKATEQAQGKPIKISTLPHEEFKRQSVPSRAFVRTGERSPYANAIISAGVAL